MPSVGGRKTLSRQNKSEYNRQTVNYINRLVIEKVIETLNWNGWYKAIPTRVGLRLHGPAALPPHYRATIKQSPLYTDEIQEYVAHWARLFICFQIDSKYQINKQLWALRLGLKRMWNDVLRSQECRPTAWRSHAERVAADEWEVAPQNCSSRDLNERYELRLLVF